MLDQPFYFGKMRYLIRILLFFTVLLFLLTILFFISLSSSSSTNSQLKPPVGLNPSRLERLTRGVDLSLWFWVDNTTDPPIQSAQHYMNYITASDLQTIKELGFRHVRLSITPTALFQEATPTVLNPTVLPYLDKALDLILSYKLGVIIDMHFDIEGASFKEKLINDASFASSYARFWNSLAQHLSTRDPEMVFLEVLNEEGAPDPQQWYAVQNTILAAMRQGAPNHTLIADSNNQDANENPEPSAILLMKPTADPNIIYNMHFYEPQTFTGQGSDSDGWATLTGLPYPYNKLECDTAINNITDPAVKPFAEEYCAEQWDITKLESRLKQVSDWATLNGVNVTVNEFGAYYYGVPKDSRLRWFQDVRTLFDKYKIGWTLWAYDDAYGLNHTELSGNTIDMEVVNALGLNSGISSYNSIPANGATLNLGNTVIGSSLSYSIQIKNSGNKILVINNPTISGPNAVEFSITTTTFPLLLSDIDPAQTLTLKCTPLTLGVRTAILNLTTNDPAQPLVSYNLICNSYQSLEVSNSVDTGTAVASG